MNLDQDDHPPVTFFLFGQDLPPSCQKRETPYISMRFSSTAGISSMSLSTEVSVSYTFVANNQHEQEETA